MLILYPDIKPYAVHRLSVDDLHTLYIEESGTPDGIPVLFVHGGPGAGCVARDRCFFDPEKYRIILFDQRGAGRSTPLAQLRDNTTRDLLGDIEKIRSYLGIDKWLLFGSAWGATLSLVYAQAHPEKVMGLILGAIFLCREKDLHWFYQEGASRVFPDYWEDYCHPIPEPERDNFIEAYYRRLNGDNELARMGAAKAWSLWAAHCATLRPCLSVIEHVAEPHMATSLASIETHYFRHNGFLEENQILDNAHRLEGIPGVIVHGRYDMVIPLDNAVALRRVWHDAELHIIRDAGHAASEPGIVDALVRATRDMARRFENED
jgi:proline iminopeptidase